MKHDFKHYSIKELAVLISAELEKHGINAVLVGGACVSIYSNNQYVSSDLDYISPASTNSIENALKNLGFFKRKGFRQFINDNCPYYIEFPPGPVSIGNEVPVTKFSKIKSLKLFTPTDCVKDRLAAFYHWNDPQSLDQAVMVAKSQKVNLKAIESWSRGENSIEKYKRFKDLLKK